MTPPALPAAAPHRDGAGGIDFPALMAPFAPFEPRPHIAVAVSGGSDSMALALLANDWARARDGCVTVLTIDHGLRVEAAAEAAQVGRWCAARGIDQVVLRWTGPHPASGIQAAARAARYRLLEGWCRAQGVLHLLVGHQRDDQAETVAMREASGSGLDGLAGMPSVAEHGAVRVLRPLLAVAHAELRAFLTQQGQGWVEDPSNRNSAFARVRVRSALSHASAGSSDLHRAGTARRLGRLRADGETEDARAFARWAMLDPAGFAWLDRRAFAGPHPLGVKTLGALLTTVSGGEFPPRRERLERLLRELVAGRAPGRTLGGCLILPRRRGLLVCREPAAVAPPMVLSPGAEILWDGRFHVEVSAAAPIGLTIAALGAEGAAAIARHLAKAVLARVPPAARAALPALCDAKEVVAVPTLGYFVECRKESKAACRVRFRPSRSLTGAGFTIV